MKTVTIDRENHPGIHICLTEKEAQAVYEMWQHEYDMEDVRNELSAWIGSEDYPDMYIMDMLSNENWIMQTAHRYRKEYQPTMPESDQLEQIVSEELEACYPSWFLDFCVTWKPRKKEDD